MFSIRTINIAPQRTYASNAIHIACYVGHFEFLLSSTISKIFVFGTYWYLKISQISREICCMSHTKVVVANADNIGFYNSIHLRLVCVEFVSLKSIENCCCFIVFYVHMHVCVFTSMYDYVLQFKILHSFICGKQ